MVPIKTHWGELDDYVALRLLFNSCSQFEGIEDEVPNDTGHLYVISAKGARCTPSKVTVGACQD